MTTKLTITLTFILSICTTVFGQTERNFSNEKCLIEVDRIDRIEISTKSNQDDSSTLSLKTLTKEQVISFSQNWNNADSLGRARFLPLFNLTIYLNSGATRHFRINGKYIKESNDYCYDLNDDNYLSNLYANAERKTVKTGSTLKTGWYYIKDKKTNFKRQLDKTSELYFIDPKVIVPVEQFKKMELTESEYEGKSIPMLVIHFDTKGTDSWSIATEKSIGGKLALIVNDKLVIAPKVNSQITGGVSALNRTDYTKQEIEEIVRQINYERQKK